jgi:hypothetical protein
VPTGRMVERFEEVQDFRQVKLKWLVLPVIICFIALAIFLVYQQFMVPKSAGGKPLSSEGLAVAVAVMLLVAVGVPLLLVSIKLVVRVDPSRLLVHFYPVNRPRNIPLTDIVSWEVREYRALADYGGYGIKYSLTKGHWCYTVSGNRGVLVRTSNGKEIMIGSQRADELAGILGELTGRKPA